MWLGVCWLEVAYLLGAVGIGISGLTVYFTPELSNFLNDLVKYGKSRSKERSKFQQFIEVPKRWFTHFYIVAVCSMTASLVIVVFKYGSLATFDHTSSFQLKTLILWLTQPNTRTSLNEMAVVLTLFLLWIHSVRRLLESLFLSVYSDTKMNILHYVTGWGHYILLPVTVLAEAPGFASDSFDSLKFTALSATETIGMVLFFWFSYHQHKCLAILAEMRRNFKGNITNYAHGIPFGDWFDSVSCPHFLFEIGIYVSLYLCTNLQSRLWIYVLVFVATNQMLAAIITHGWYKEKFKKLYPESRKAIIPYLI